MKRERVHWFAWVCWLGVAIWVSVVFWLSSRGTPELVDEFPFIIEVWDKFLHFVAYFAGAVPFVVGFRLSKPWSWTKVFWVSVACVSGYGALDEVHQYWTPSRSGLSVADWIADTLGGLAGAGVAVFAQKIIERRIARRAAGVGQSGVGTGEKIEAP